MCGCPQEKLCDMCRASRFDCLRGTAACRADTWLASLGRHVRAQPWPGYTDKVAAIARRKVEDLARDERLLALLAAEFAAAASKRWSATSRTESLRDSRPGPAFLAQSGSPPENTNRHV